MHEQFLSSTKKLLDLKFEIPKHLVILQTDRLLGEGEFCTVHQGLLKTRLDPEETIGVAVKQMKSEKLA